MVQSRSGLGLAPESLHRLAILSYALGQEFESNKAVEARVLSLIHHTHSTAAEFLKDAIVGDGLTNQR